MDSTSQDFSYDVGIDWATTHPGVQVEDPTGQEVLDFQIEESLWGYAQLDQRLSRLEVSPQQVALALETPQGLLLDHLLTRGYVVYALNPKLVKKQQEALWSSATKDDGRDAWVLT
jgi:hypothetical protein